MRISDWSSDVCSSDLADATRQSVHRFEVADAHVRTARLQPLVEVGVAGAGEGAAVVKWPVNHERGIGLQRAIETGKHRLDLRKIGRATCRERVCQNV